MGAEEAPRSGQRGRGADAGLRIRPVTGADVAALRDVRLRALASDPDAFGSTLAQASALPGAEWEAWARASEESEEQRTFVVDDERGGPFLGLALVLLDEDGPGAHLYAMWVAPEARGRSLGLGLCEMCCRWAVARGRSELRLAVFAGNRRARRAYANAGFVLEESAAIRTADGRDLEELRLVRAIAPDGIL